VKQQYWLYVSIQRQRNQVSSVRLYPVQLPEQRIDGVMFQPSTKLLRIEELQHHSAVQTGRLPAVVRDEKTGRTCVGGNRK